MTAVVYSTIVILSLYLALVAQGFVIALAFIVGGIAFFALQCHFHKYYNDLVTNDEMDGNSDSDDHGDHLRLPPV
jgi:cell division protein FtsW (lipid II flippase)